MSALGRHPNQRKLNLYEEFVKHIRGCIASVSLLLPAVSLQPGAFFTRGFEAEQPRRRRTYADHPHYFAFGLWLRGLPVGTGNGILWRRRRQPDYPDRDHPVAVEGHLRGAPAGARPRGRAEGGYGQNGDFPHVAAWVPPPRNQTSNLEKTTVGAQDYRVLERRGIISGNHLVIGLMRQ